MRVFVTALGCRLNEAEAAAWRRGLAARGLSPVARARDADLVVLNTCAVTAEAARKSRKLARRLHRQSPTARLVLTGCLTALDPDAAAEIAGVDLVVGGRDKDRLPELVAERLAPGAMPRRAAEPGAAAIFPGDRTRAFVKVQDGCRNRCAFCIVTVARGEERSRPIGAVVEEARALHAAGYQEVVLTGVHLGGYGSDLGATLADLVAALLRHTGIPRLRLSSLEPWDLPPGFFRLFEDPRLCPHLHLPLQSGSAAVLRRMARRCPPERYAALVAEARAAIPDLTLTTDVICGFPGEGEAEWAETMAFVERIRFAGVHVFVYSPRAGTAAARMGGRVPEAVKRARSRALHALADRLGREHRLARLGQVRPVLWEGPPEPLPGGRARYLGFTDTYLRVEATLPAGAALDGRITPARLVALAPGGRLRAEPLPGGAAARAPAPARRTA